MVTRNGMNNHSKRNRRKQTRVGGGRCATTTAYDYTSASARAGGKENIREEPREGGGRNERARERREGEGGWARERKREGERVEERDG